jgi:hypothetical protein
MNKVVLATLLACGLFASGVSCALAQTAAPAAPAAAQPVNLGTQPAAAPCALPDAEYTAYTNAMGQSNPQAKAAGIEKYLTDFPTSACPGIRLSSLVELMTAYSAYDTTGVKILDSAARVLQLEPANLRALTFEAYLGKQAADAVTDPAAKQAALDAAAAYAQKGLVASKADSVTDADFKKMQSTAFPIFYNVIGDAAFNKKDNAAAIDAFKKELASVPLAATQQPGSILLDTYYLGEAYYQSTPPDYLSCSFYASRAVAYAPPAVKPQMSPIATYCYKKYHDGADGYDVFSAAAKDNLNPPDGLFASIKPGLTPAEKIHNIIVGTPDLSILATADKEMVFQYGSPDDAAKVWDTIKGKSFEIPDTLVITSSPTVLTVAVTDDAKQSKTADFTFNMTAPDPVPDLKPNATPAQKLAYKKEVAAAQAKADAITAATAVGQTVTLTGTYDSFTPNPVQIIMKDGEVVLPKAAAKPAAKAAPAHRTAAPKK